MLEKKGEGADRVVGYAPLACLAGFGGGGSALENLALHSPALTVHARRASTDRSSLAAVATIAQQLTFEDDEEGPSSAAWISSTPALAAVATGAASTLSSSEALRTAASDARVQSAITSQLEHLASPSAGLRGTGPRRALGGDGGGRSGD